MRRLTIGFTVVALVLLFASVAGAVPSGFCDDRPNRPQCTTTQPPSTTTSTTTTSTTTAPGLAACDNHMTISGGGTTSFECLWKPTYGDGVEEATITVSNFTGTIASPPTVFVRDDSPGDICLLTQAEEDWELSESGYEVSFDLSYHAVPTGYDAWLGQDYWTFVLEQGIEPGTHWCAPQDPVLDSIREDANGGTLHFMVSFNAKKGGSLDINLSPGNNL